MTLADTAVCEFCGDDTYDLTDCEHRQLCPDCRADYGCRECRPGDARLLNWRVV